MTCMVRSRPKLGTQPVFKFILGAPIILYAKSVFLAVNASLRRLNNVTGV
jgi:hypothetical protein